MKRAGKKSCEKYTMSHVISVLLNNTFLNESCLFSISSVYIVCSLIGLELRIEVHHSITFLKQHIG